MTTKGKILIVEDDPDALIYLSALLEDNDYETLTAPNGDAGLKKARETQPDLILLDLMMPEKSGMWFLNEIKQDSALKDVPIIVESGASKVTGFDMKDYLEKQPFKERKKEALGKDIDTTPDAYLDKPVNEEQLLETVKKLIRKR